MPVEGLTVGTRLRARYGDEFYLAEVMSVSQAKDKQRTPVKVHYVGYGSEDDKWLPLSDLRSKKLTKEDTAAGKPAGGKTKVKAKAKATVNVAVDYSALTKGTNLQAQANDGKWYTAAVVDVSKAARRKSAPVLINYVGYTSASDEWLGADQLRSKLLRSPKARKKSSGAATNSGTPFQMVPILKSLRNHASKADLRAVVETSEKAEPKTLTYQKLLSNVEANRKVVASLLAGRPEGFPKHVAFLVNPSMAYVVTELSVWAAGGACVPLSVHSPVPELEYFVEDSDASLLIADEASASKLQPVAEKFGRKFAKITSSDDFVFSIALQGGDEAIDDKVKMTVSLQDPALILYTSGTTGKPKGVVHTFRSVSTQHVSLTRAWRWSKNDYTLHVLPLHHIHGVQNILNTALYNGAGVEFTPFDAGFCLQRICSGDVTCFHAVPTIYVKFTQYLEKLDEAGRDKIKQGLRNEKLRYMVSGSAALPVPTMSSWAEISGHVLLERYGMTEIGMGLSNRIRGTRYPGCVGWALPKVRVKTDEDGAILIKGPLVFKEYYKKEEATKKEFTEDGWFKTGDNCQVGGSEEELKAMLEAAKNVEKATGRPRPDSELDKADPKLASIYKIMGRSSVDIIKSGGYKISALEIESVLLQHEKIKECAVVGKPDETWGEKVTAVAVLDGELSLKELRDWGKERMATYKVPQELEVVTELPRNQMGKLEKKKILDRYK